MIIFTELSMYFVVKMILVILIHLNGLILLSFNFFFQFSFLTNKFKPIFFFFSFKVFRNQIKSENNFTEDGVKKEELENKKNICFVCGNYGGKVCGKCHSVYYCSKNHQVLHWGAGHKTRSEFFLFLFFLFFLFFFSFKLIYIYLLKDVELKKNLKIMKKILQNLNLKNLKLKMKKNIFMVFFISLFSNNFLFSLILTFSSIKKEKDIEEARDDEENDDEYVEGEEFDDGQVEGFLLFQIKKKIRIFINN